MSRIVSRLVWTLPILAAFALLRASGIEAQVGDAHNDEERAVIAGILDRAAPSKTVLAVGAEAIYVIAERRSPWRFPRLIPYWDRLIAWAEPGGCGALLDQVREPAWPIVLFRDRSNSGVASRCGTSVRAELDKRYQVTIVRLPFRRPHSFRSHRWTRRWIVWRVYDTRSPRGP